LISLSSNSISDPIHQNSLLKRKLSKQDSDSIRQNSLSKRRKFIPFDATKPFKVPSSNNSNNLQVINKKIQKVSSQANDISPLPRIILENCKNCQVDIKINISN